MAAQVVLTRFDEGDIKRLAEVLASVLDIESAADRTWWHAVAYCVLELLTEGEEN